MFSIAHFLHDLLLFVTLLLSPPVASHLWHLLNILQCEAQKSAEEKNNNPTLTLVTGCLVCQLTHHNPLVAHVTSLAQAKTSNYPVFFLFMVSSAIHWHCPWTKLASWHFLFNTGNFPLNPVNGPTTRTSARWKIKLPAVARTFQEQRQLGSRYYTFECFRSVMCVMLKDIPSTESGRGSRGGSETKSIQCPRSHLGENEDKKHWHVYEELNTHKYNGGDLQITGIGIPEERRPQLLCSHLSYHMFSRESFYAPSGL